MMTLRQIRHFIAVAETGSISAGAQAVFVSQSSLTLAIQQLETEIGVRLFDRHAKGMTLTHQGHQFLRQSYLILATVDNAKRSLQIGTESLTGKLTVGVTSLVFWWSCSRALNRPIPTSPCRWLKMNARTSSICWLAARSTSAC
ncbi:hypothetical protein SL267_36240 [Serratia marcescens]|nr:LysR family transcriptional regulator [Serratia marcescens]BCZ59007.1 hypothetical protein SL267_36240 [Serratia marcescens]